MWILDRGQIILTSQVVATLLIAVFIFIFLVFMQQYSESRREKILKKMAIDGLDSAALEITKTMRGVEPLKVQGKIELFKNVKMPDLCVVSFRCEDNLILKLSYTGTEIWDEVELPLSCNTFVGSGKASCKTAQVEFYKYGDGYILQLGDKS